MVTLIREGAPSGERWTVCRWHECPPQALAEPGLPFDASTAAQWLRGRVTGALSCDSRKVGAGDGFLAWPGAAPDGRKFVLAGLEQGARACRGEAAGGDGGDCSGASIAGYAGL